MGSSGELGNRSIVALSGQPIRLLLLGPNEALEDHVLALGSRPTVIYGHGSAFHGLSYASLNLRHVSHAAPFTAG